MSFVVLKFSKSTISEICKNLDPLFHPGTVGLLEIGKVPFVIVDAMVIRVREDNRVRQRGLLIAVGVNEEGYSRNTLGFMVGTVSQKRAGVSFFPG